MEFTNRYSFCLRDRWLVAGGRVAGFGGLCPVARGRWAVGGRWPGGWLGFGLSPCHRAILSEAVSSSQIPWGKSKADVVLAFFAQGSAGFSAAR